ncbi:MAG TPA: hypothetical protein VHW00_19055 [Thermoanaerobaculia bacterium]|nr:hypothetical protein [Thermoanaerobaculia bacterium]
MKRVALVLALLALTTPLLAGWYPTFNPRNVRIAVGETSIITVQARWSGIAFPELPTWSFATVDSNVAIGEIEMHTTKPVELPVTGIAPGETSIAQRANGRFVGSSFVNVTVYCADEPSLTAAEPRIESRLGEEVTLRAMSPIAERSRFLWYAGRIGDTARPIPFGGTELTFAPESSGTHHYWVMATTACRTSSVEFEVVVKPARRRSVR